MKPESIKIQQYKRRFLIAAIIVAAIYMGPGGSIISNISSSAIEELGCSVSSFNLYLTFQAIPMALLFPVAARLLNTKYIGRIVAASIAVEASGYILMAFYHRVQLFYASGLLLGIGGSVTVFMMFPILVNQWFPKRAGTILGIISALRNIGAAVGSSVFGALIVGMGWRNALSTFPLVTASIALPFALFVFKRPQDVISSENTAPVADAPEPKDGILHTIRNPFFPVLFLISLMFAIAASGLNFIVPYSTMELHNAVTTGATAYSVMTTAGIFCSLILGVLNDRFGVRIGLLWGLCSQGVGFLLLILATNQPALLFVGAAMVGLGNGAYQIQLPLIVGSVVSGKAYSSVLSTAMMGSNLLGAVIYPLLSMFYDYTNSFKGIFLCAALAWVVALSLSFVLTAKSKKSPNT